MGISEKIILKREKMSEREDLEKQLADLKRQREEITKQEIPVKQKVPPPAKREAPPKKEKKVSFDEMLDTVARYQEEHGEKVAQIDDNDMKINFFAPKEALDKMNNKMSKKEITDFLISIPWGYNWGVGMARAVLGTTRWNALSKSEQDDIIKGLIHRKLTPALTTPMMGI